MTLAVLVDKKKLHRNLPGKFIAWFMLAWITLPISAEAFPITFRFGGTVTNSPISAINVGDTIDGTYTFESTAIPQFPNGPDAAIYENAILSYSVQVGSVNVYATSGRIQVANNFNNSFDAYNVGSDAFTTSPVAGFTGVRSFFQAVDSTQTAVTTLSLPLTPPNLLSFGFRNYILRFVDSSNISYSVVGSFNTLEQVPAPGALALLGLGLLGLGATRRRKAA